MVFITMSLVFKSGQLFNIYSQLLFISSIILYMFSKKNIFYTFYINYLLCWIFTGNINYIIYSDIWNNWKADIVFANNLYCWFLFILTISGLLFNKNISSNRESICKGEKHNQKKKNTLKMMLFLSSLSVLVFSIYFLWVTGWGGIYLNKVTNENRFSINLPSYISILAVAFVIMLILFVELNTFRKKYIIIPIIYIIFSFFILTSGGSRFTFFQMILVSFFYVLYTGRGWLIKRYKKLIIVGLFAFISMQTIIPMLRDENSSRKNILSIITFFRTWGGEYRDGAASLVLLKQDDVNEIKNNYIKTIIVPIIPRIVTNTFGINKDEIFKKAGAFYMQGAYKIKFGAIRIGGILETYYWKGMLGISFFAIINYLAIYLIDKHTKKWYYINAIKAYLSSTIIYYIPSQSSFLLSPLFSFIYVLTIFYIISNFITRYSKRISNKTIYN